MKTPLHLSLRDEKKQSVYWKAVGATFVMLFLIELALAMFEAPRLRIFEQIIVCKAAEQHGYRHFAQFLEVNGNTEHVQSELALIVGWNDTLSAAADILMAVPFGLLADRYGRTLVLKLNLLASLLASLWVLVVIFWWNTFPIRLTWLGTAFNLLGGGPTVTASIFFIIIADVSTEAQRITSFTFLAIAGLVGQLAGASLGSELMSIWNPWVPVSLASMVLLIATTLAWLMPETRTAADPLRFDTHTEVEMILGEKTPLMATFDDLPHEDDTDLPPASHSQCRVLGKYVALLKDHHLLLLSLTFPLHALSRSTMKFFLQYATQRYSITMAEAGFLNAIRATANILLLIVVLPVLSKTLSACFRFTPVRKDLILTRGSMALLTVGSFAIALSPNVNISIVSLVTYTLGTGFALFVRSLATSLVQPADIGKLYSLITLFDALGQMAAGPLLAKLVNVGVHLGKAYSGLPFLLGGALHALILVVLCFVKIRDTQTSHRYIVLGGYPQGSERDSQHE